jgi:hypothetical protein
VQAAAHHLAECRRADAVTALAAKAGFYRLCANRQQGAALTAIVKRTTLPFKAFFYVYWEIVSGQS